MDPKMWCVRGARSAALGTVVVLTTLGAHAGVASASAGHVTAPAVAAATTATTCKPAVNFNRINFSHPTKIDNLWLPLTPGTQFVLTGQADRGTGTLPHDVIFTVTDLTKVIDGVRTRVIWDRDLNDGELTEAELAFFAQDNAGNVWSMGEYPEEYVNGKFVGAPSTWIPGQAKAKAGLAMLADPVEGTPPYLQGFAPDIEFLDCAQVFNRGQKACVPLKCYDHLLITDETSPLDGTGAHQRKFYAPGVGNVRVAPVNDPEAEILALTQLNTLSAKALTDAANSALKLERRAYQVSDVYATTAPMRR